MKKKSILKKVGALQETGQGTSSFAAGNPVSLETAKHTLREEAVGKEKKDAKA